jgi:soluble lytic murein transglycosylase-like protein
MVLYMVTYFRKFKMKFSKTCIAILPGVLAILCAGFFMGKATHPIPGLSPYYIASGQWEERVFLQNQNFSALNDAPLGDEVRGQIVKVLANYKTGLGRVFRDKIPALIIHESKKYGYDPLFLTAVIITESSFNNWARSRQGALGLMQIRPKTAIAMARETSREWKGNPTLYDPGANIALGAYYLDKLVKRFGDLHLALEAYNHGPTKLSRYLRKGYRPKGYSRKVIHRYEMIRAQPV